MDFTCLDVTVHRLEIWDMFLTHRVPHKQGGLGAIETLPSILLKINIINVSCQNISAVPLKQSSKI